jgi:hypothetical protein
MSRSALFAASAVGVVVGAADCSLSLVHYGAQPFLDDDASPLDGGSVQPGDGASAPVDASGAGDANNG